MKQALPQRNMLRPPATARHERAGIPQGRRFTGQAKLKAQRKRKEMVF